jgi:hypothetical protein
MAKTKEEKIAKRISELLNDVTLDLDEVGKQIVDNSYTISYNRLVMMTEAAMEEKERVDDKRNNLW